MTDSDLLKFAAIAAEIELWHCKVFTRGLTRKVSDNGVVQWNPLDNDGDAFRLAVKLRMKLDLMSPCVVVRTPEGVTVFMETEGCRGSDARLAIVEAAASIGKKIWEERNENSSSGDR